MPRCPPLPLPPSCMLPVTRTLTKSKTWHTRTQGGVQMPACPLERCPPRQARPLCAPFLRLRTPITHLSSVAFASSSSCSHSPYHPHGSRLHRSTRPLEYASPDRRQGCALRHGRRTSLARLPLERPSPFSNATPHQVQPSSEVQDSQLARPAARQTATCASATDLPASPPRGTIRVDAYSAPRGQK